MATAIVRDRWQVTIPPQVRDVWVEPGSVLVWEAEEEKLVVTPYTKKRKPNWDKILEGIKRCRSYKPKKNQEMSGSEFVAMDRYNH
jgi:bifunctional DNA-binding transcriptional regulator/antitoxin component of YhaV-PrlF toxin-antitoxin module